MASQDLIKFHFECRYRDNELLRDDAFNEVQKKFSKNYFLELETLNDPSILAFVGITKSDRKNGPQYVCYFDYQIKSLSAQNWVQEKLTNFLSKYRDVFVEVFVEYKPLIDFFNNKNFKVRRIYTVSSANEMIKGFNTHFPSLPKIPDGLKIRKLNSSDIPSALKLLKDEFGKNPQHGPNDEAFINNLKKMIEDDLLQTNHSQYAIIDSQGTFLGHFAAFLEDHPIWQKAAGFHFMLHESIQKKNLLPFMYSIIFNDIENQGIKTVTGSTTHVAVLKNFSKLNRRPFLYSFVQDNSLLGLEHFTPYIK
jgi:hypothetical protein